MWEFQSSMVQGTEHSLSLCHLYPQVSWKWCLASSVYIVLTANSLAGKETSLYDDFCVQVEVHFWANMNQGPCLEQFFLWLDIWDFDDFWGLGHIVSPLTRLLLYVNEVTLNQVELRLGEGLHPIRKLVYCCLDKGVRLCIKKTRTPQP